MDRRHFLMDEINWGDVGKSVCLNERQLGDLMSEGYRVTVLKWESHNPKHKKHYKKFMLSNGFFSDPKIVQLTPTEVLIYLELLCICSESASNQFAIHVKSMPKQFRISVKSMSNCLERLQSLQLVTAEKIDRIERKRREETEEKRREVPETTKKAPARPPKSRPETNPFSPPAQTAGGKSGKVWDAFSKAFFKKYKTEAVKNRKVNSQLCQLVDRLGVVEAPLVAEFYLTHNDFLYTKSRHSVDFLIRDAEKLRTEWATGVKSTKAGAEAAESKDFYQQQMSDFQEMFLDEKGEV